MPTDVTTEPLPSGVGLTAVAMAYARALEAHRPDSLFDDPLAADFVLAFQSATGEESAAQMIDSLSVRTRFFDDVIRAAVAGGARQLVILAAGLDTRAFRLGLPAEVTLYEVDQYDILGFKERVLDLREAQPTCARVAVPADLRADWSADLAASGLDPAQPVTWVAEGLLQYLTLDQAAGLVGQVGALSPAGGRLAFDHVNEAFLKAPAFAKAVKQLGQIDASFRSSLEDPAGWLAGLGWSAEVTHSWALADDLGKTLPDLKAKRKGEPRAWLVRADRKL